jgi:hypothetical protein
VKYAWLLKDRTAGHLCAVNHFNSFFQPQTRSFMQRLFLLLPVLLISLFAHAQTCWNFEQQCSDPGNAFNLNCVPNASAASGTPGLTSNALLTSSQAAEMVTFACVPAFYPNTRLHAEGILLRFNFVAGNRYTLTFSCRVPALGGSVGSNPYLGLHLVNSMSHIGGISPGNEPCLNTNDLLPPLPPGAQTITTLNSTNLGNGWVTHTIVIAPNANFNQLWFRPFINLSEININDDPVFNFLLDDVCIEEIDCTPEPYTLSICRRGEDGNTLSVTIDGANGVPQSAWKLFPMSKCPNGTPGAGQVINWTGPKTFEVPAGSGCYRLFYAWAKPNCPLRVVTQHFSTDDDYYPVCSDCEKWIIRTLVEPCETISFYASQSGGFPSGTKFEATINGVPVDIAENGALEYFPQEQGDNILLNVCITVRQPDCPPVTKCINYVVPDCDGGGGGWDGSFDPLTANPDQGMLQQNGAIVEAVAAEGGEEDCIVPIASTTVCRDLTTGNISVAVNNYNNLPVGGSWSLYYFTVNGPGIKTKVDVPFAWKGRYWLHFRDVVGVSSYTLTYTWNNGQCAIFFTITVNDVLPYCGQNCNNWSISTLTESCETYLFYVNSSTPLPNGTTITATLNGNPVLQVIPGQVEYSPFIQGDNTFITVCFTVTQPGCAPLTLCRGMLIPECEGLPPFNEDASEDRRTETASTTFRYTNPADQVILFSQALENAQVELFTMQGVQVRSIQSENIDRVPVADLPNGQYLLSIRHSGGRENKLVLIQHRM